MLGRVGDLDGLDFGLQSGFNELFEVVYDVNQEIHVYCYLNILTVLGV